jgi:MtN3 and saliva related transmembrane protein
MSLTEIIGYTAGILTAITFLPQVIKTWRDKKAKEISLTMFLIAFVNEILWLFYGVMLINPDGTQGNWVIILTNSLMLLMSGAMIYLKFKYGKE